ncbi:MAG: bifunctional RNase H/acid phosphatase [Nocardioidaceae bacterium]
MAYRRVVVEADGGSRGNPGLAAYGALVRDPETGEVIAERAEVIGVATNNVAEYRGLIAGLELAAEHAPEADLEVRMDSKLVIEQMAGRWKVKHPDMRPLAVQAQRLAPIGVEWTWVPREQNHSADAILNVALDIAQGKKPKRARDRDTIRTSSEDDADPTATSPGDPLVGWRRDRDHGAPTTFVLLRHGATEQTGAKLFSGRGGKDPGLDDAGAEQAARAASWLKRRGGVDGLVSSPMRRARETAGYVADELGLEVVVDDGFAEASFGEWDSLDLETVERRWPDELTAWLASPDARPPGGESTTDVAHRARQSRDALVRAYPGGTVVVVSHVTPIKALVQAALDAPTHVLHRMTLAPGSLTTLEWWPDGVPTMRGFSALPD